MSKNTSSIQWLVTSLHHVKAKPIWGEQALEIWSSDLKSRLSWQTCPHDEIFPKSNYKFWRLTKTSYRPPGHQGQANLRSRHCASGVPIWNLWSRQRLPSLGVVLAHTRTGQSRPARGKKPEKNTSATASLDSSTEIEISLSLSLGISGSDFTTLFTRSSAFSITRPCFVVG